MDTILTFINSIDPMIGGGVGAFLVALVSYSIYKKRKSKNNPLPKISKVEKEDDTSIISTPEPKKLWQKKKTAGLSFEDIIRSAIMFDETNDKEQAAEFLEDALELSFDYNKTKLQLVLDNYRNPTNTDSLKELYEQYYINNNEITPESETSLDIPEGFSNDELLTLSQDIKEDNDEKNSNTLLTLGLEEENKNSPTKESNEFLLEKGLSALESEIHNFQKEEKDKEFLSSSASIFGSPELESFMKEVAEDSEIQNDIIERENFDDQERVKALLAESFSDTIPDSSENSHKKFDGIKNMGSTSLSFSNPIFSHKYSMYVNWMLKEKYGEEHLHRDFIELSHKWPTKEAIDELNSIIDKKVDGRGTWALISTTEISD